MTASYVSELPLAVITAGPCGEGWYTPERCGAFDARVPALWGDGTALGRCQGVVLAGKDGGKGG